MRFLHCLGMQWEECRKVCSKKSTNGNLRLNHRKYRPLSLPNRVIAAVG